MRPLNVLEQCDEDNVLTQTLLEMLTMVPSIGDSRTGDLCSALEHDVS
jgi:hypothetical protein